MADPKYQYATQNNFTGGIATEPELRRVTKAGEVTVAEAADVWAPNGVLKRRPGVQLAYAPEGLTNTIQLDDSDVIPGAFFVTSTGTTILPSYTGSAGSSPVIIASGGVAGDLYIPVKDGYSSIDWNTFYSGTVTESGRFAVWAPDGESPATAGQPIDFRITSSTTVNFGQPVSSGTVYLKVSITSSSGDLVVLTYTVSYLGVTVGTVDTAWTLLGGSFSPLPSGQKYFQLLHLSSDAGNSVRFFASNTSTLPSGVSTLVSTDPSLFTLTGLPPSWATVVDANRTYVAYANQVYEYRPDLATPFRLAQVNSDPAIVGSGATYDPTIFAQYNVFPRANQIVYFNGLLFFTDIKGAPNAVQWGGPAIDGAVDILPVLSYAILSDSRDNSPNVGFGVYNSNLYVFKQNSIWALIPAGQSEVDGSYLFTSRLVTSGAGCSAPGSIVSTPRGIIFYNAGGFYIFDGQKTRKLTDTIKQLFDAIIPGNAYQMQAAHWPQQHSYVVTCKMSHPWSSDVFEDLPSVFDGTLCYDYQNEAWWLWLSVSGKALYMDSAGNFLTQTYHNELRVLDPNKEYDSDALAKSTAQPHIKTQRFGYGESLQKQYRELRVTGEIDNLDIDTSVEINDQLLAATDYDMTFIPVDYEEIPLGDTIPDGDSYSPPWGRFEVPIEVTNDGQWAQVRLNGGYGPFTVYNINLGYFVEGRNG